MQKQAISFRPDQVLDPSLLAKYLHLRGLLQEYGSALVGYSGGVDSAFLAGVTNDVLGPDRMLACLAVSPSLAKREYEGALQIAGLLKMRVETYHGTEFEDERYRANDANRCYYCKSDLFMHLRDFASRMGFHKILYGGNLDDLQDYRPGQKAAKDFEALAPMAEAGLNKADIRALSQIFGLPTFDKPAMPCLSSRIPYGQAVTVEKLSMVETGEAILAENGFRNYRIRHEGETARIEVPMDQLEIFSNPSLRGDFIGKLKKLGFKRILLDLEGFRSGNLNAALPEAVRKKGIATP